MEPQKKITKKEVDEAKKDMKYLLFSGAIVIGNYYWWAKEIFDLIGVNWFIRAGSILFVSVLGAGLCKQINDSYKKIKEQQQR